MAEGLPDGLHPVPPGKQATIVTYLEMTAPPVLLRRPAPDGVTLARHVDIDVYAYRALFLRIGGDLLWWSRLAMDDGQLRSILTDPDVVVSVLERDGEAVGLIEFDHRAGADVELAFFGLVPGVIGGGLGRWMMTEGLAGAWARPATRRVFVHTCHFDSPAALPFYLRSGFSAYRTVVEVSDDPRLVGLLPREAAPQVPVIAAGEG